MPDPRPQMNFAIVNGERVPLDEPEPVPTPLQAVAALGMDKPNAWAGAETIGAARVGDRYMPRSWSEIMTSSNPILGILEHLMGPSRPPSVAVADPYGVEAFQKGAGQPPLMMGTVKQVGAPGAMETIGKTFPRFAKAIRAFHGSPHDFDQFSMSKIGTGEGAQAYGHGLYFAENEGTARAYRSALTPDAFPDRDPRNGIAKILAFKGEAEGLPMVRKAYASLGDGLDDAIRDARQSLATNGRMYEVEINADPADFLDWDAPLSQQSEKVQQSARPFLKRGNGGYWNHSGDRFIGEDPTGAQVHQAAEAYREMLFQRQGVRPAGREGVTETLKKAGIPGIKYLDQGSRASAGGEIIDVSKAADGWRSKIRVKDRSVGFQNSPTTAFTTSMPFPTEAEARAWAQNKINEGTRNYVVFDDSLVTILKKYGVAVGVIEGLRRKAQQQGGKLAESDIQGVM